MQRVGIIVARGLGDLGRLSGPFSVEGFSLILVGFRLFDIFVATAFRDLLVAFFCNCASQNKNRAH